MVHIEKIIVKGKTYYKLVHSVRKDGKVKGISKYLGKKLPPSKELERLKKEFLAKIVADREKVHEQNSSSEKRKDFVQSLDKKYRSPLQSSFPIPKKDDSSNIAKSLDKKYLTPMQSTFHVSETRDTSPLNTSLRFRELIKNLNEVVYIADPNTFLVTYVSPSVEKMFGYTHIEWLADSNILERLIHSSDRENFLKKYKQALKSKSFFSMQYRVNTRKNKTIWVKHKLIWEKDSGGYVTALIGIFENVTLKQDSQDDIELMYDDSPVAMMQMDFSTLNQYLKTYNLKTKKDVWERLAENPHELQEVQEMVQIISINKSTLQLFKAKNKENFIKHFYTKHFFRDSNQVFVQEIMAIAQGKTEFESPLNIYSFEGRRITLALKWRVPLLYQDSYNKVLVTYIDSAFQRQMGREINIKNYAIESSPGAIVITDLEGKITYANPSFLKLWSLENLSLVMYKPITDYIPNEKKAFKILHTIHKKEQWQGEIILGKEKKAFLKSTGMMVRDSFDEPIAIVFSFIDLTEIKKSEQIRLEFTNIAAHELKTPLVPLKTLLTMIYEDPKQFGVNKQGMEHLTVCMRNVERLNILIGDILDISRLEAGGMNFKFGKYNLLNIVQEVVNNFKETVEKKGVKLRTQVPENLPILKGDGQKISQVLGNLVKNAINFTDQGSIFIKLSLNEREVQVDVIDTGMGIPKDAQAKLFTKFYQVQDITTRKSKGSGLGLAISKGIIEHHQGRIWAHSEGKNMGSTFSFTLPLKPTLHKEKVREEEKKRLIGEEMLLEESEAKKTKEKKQVRPINTPISKSTAKPITKPTLKPTNKTPVKNVNKEINEGVSKKVKKINKNADVNKELTRNTKVSKKTKPISQSTLSKNVTTQKLSGGGGSRLNNNSLPPIYREGNLKQKYSDSILSSDSIIPALIWNDSVSFGYTLLERFYKKFLSAVNQLITVFNQDETYETVSQVLILLKDYVYGCLPAEEKDMQLHKYPKLEQHKKVHRGFVKKYDQLSQKNNLPTTDKKQLAKEVLLFLVDWWIDHIEKEDHAYCKFIKDQQYKGKKSRKN